jgi:SAM-dependent methyltransferase
MSARAAILNTVRSVGLMRLVNVLGNRWYWFVKRIAILRRHSDIDAVYTRGYFKAETDMTEPTADAVVGILANEFNPDSVTDVGCGTAVYLRHFEARGVAIQGFEGSQHAIDQAEVDSERIHRHDFRTLLAWDRTYDLVISFEVGEHLPDASAATFAASIARLGDRVAFSAAQPGQGGTDHINEQPSSYWIDHFAACGMTYNDAVTQRLRARLTEEDCVWWLRTNLLVFERTEST